MADSSKLLTGAGAQSTVRQMGEAAADFLASLAADQVALACLDFQDHEKRTFWHYTPIPREGLPLSLMNRHQQQLAQKLVASGLSHAGYVTASTIMGLETTLDAVERWTYPLPGRDNKLFYVRIFGRPHAVEPWGWSFEGHHISLNYTIVKGQIVAPTPTFFGANPAESALSATSSLRPLAGTEDLARELVRGLNEEQRAAAVLSSTAPPDIVLTNRPYARAGELLADENDLRQWRSASRIADAEVEVLRYSETPAGIVAAAMREEQRDLLQALIGEYIHRMPDELAEIETQKLLEHGLNHIHFAWAGGLERRQPHYYRIQGSHFLAEYDNTQNDANHIHSVWRDPGNEFGADILARHYAHSH